MASTLEGISVLTKRLKALGGLEKGTIMRKAVVAAMHPVLEQARQTIPVGAVSHHLRGKGSEVVSPGYAKASLHLVGSSSKAKGTATAKVSTTKEADYAVRYVELGTRYQRAQAFLAPALEEKRADVETTLRDQIGAAVERLAKS